MNLKNRSKHIHVVCAIIERDGFVLAAQRKKTSDMPLKWEFPGGKIEQNETAQEALHRELYEELGITVVIHKELGCATYTYPEFIITLYPFVCTIRAGVMVLHEHAEIRWCSPDMLELLDWAEADVPVLALYKQC